MSDLGDRLRALNACEEACEWADNYKTSRDAWAACEHGDRMLWLLGRLAGPPESESRRRFVITVCACVRPALAYVPDGEDCPRVTIETAERWARQEEGVTLRDVRIAADRAASAAAAAATASCATDSAAYAAAYAAYAACHASFSSAANAAANAAAASGNAAAATVAGNAAAYDAAAAAYTTTVRQCSEIVRAHYADPPELPGPTAKEVEGNG